MQPLSLVALLALVLLFGFQRKQIIAQPMVIAILAVPTFVQVYFNAGLAYWLAAGLVSIGALPPRRRSSAPAISSNLPSPPRSACSG